MEHHGALWHRSIRGWILCSGFFSLLAGPEPKASSQSFFFHHMSTLFDNLFFTMFIQCVTILIHFAPISHHLSYRISPFLIIFPWFSLGFCFGFVPLFQHFQSRFSRWSWGSATGLGTPGDGDGFQRSHARGSRVLMGTFGNISYFFLSMKVSYWGNMGKSSINHL